LLAHGRWFSPGTPASSTTKTGRHDTAEILLKVALNTKNQKSNQNHSLKPHINDNILFNPFTPLINNIPMHSFYFQLINNTLGSCTNKTDCHDITEILLKMALNTINKTKPFYFLLINNTLGSCTNKTDCHDITEILLKMALNTINKTKPFYFLLIKKIFS
jgi:hypothetical protein